MMSDKRTVERFEFFIVVEFKPVKDQTEPYLGITRNFSREGFSFESRDFDLEPGETLKFKFKQPRSDLMVIVQGEIIWKERADKLQCMTGVRFRDADDNKIWRIMDIVSAAGIATAEFFDNEDASEEVYEGNGAGQEVSQEIKLSSDGPVDGNGGVVSEDAVYSGPSKKDIPANHVDAAAIKPEPVIIQEIETEDKPEPGTAMLQKKKASIFITVAAFAIGIVLFVILREYKFEHFVPAFVKPSPVEETGQELQVAVDDGLQGETVPGDSGPLLQEKGSEADSALTEQGGAPDAYMTAEETAGDNESDDIQQAVPAPENLREASVSGDAGSLQSETGKEEKPLLPGEEKASDMIPSVDKEISLPETRKKQPLLLAKELVKEKPFIQKSEQTEMHGPVPEKDSAVVEKEKTGDTAFSSSEMLESKETHKNNMLIAVIPDITASEEHKPVIGKSKKEPGPVSPVTAGGRTPEMNEREFDSSVQHAGEETTVANEGDTNADTEKALADTPGSKEAGTEPVLLSETVSSEEIRGRSDRDAEAVLPDDGEIQTAALDETQSIKEEKIDIFEELFDNNNNDWDVFSTYAASAEIKDGEYRIENKRKKGAHFIFSHHDFPHDRDFITEVDIKPGKTIYSHSYGFVLGAQDVYNNYIFRVINNRYFLISKYHKGVLQNLGGGTIEEGVVRKDSLNTLRIEKRGSAMRFFVNEHFVDEVSSFSFDGSKIGFVIEGQLKISVERIHSQIISY